MLAVLILFFIFLSLIFLLWYRHYYIPYKVFSKLGIPHPPVEPFTGNVNRILKQGLIESLNNDIDKYGKVVGWYIGTYKWVMVADPNMLREIFIKSSDHFNQRPENPIISIARGDLPAGLIYLKKDKWKVVKPIVTPSFSAKKLKLMSPLIERSCISLKERFAVICESKKSADLFDVYGQFTMETVLGAAFGSQVNVLKGEGDSLTEAAAGILVGANINQLLWGYVIMSHFSGIVNILLAIGSSLYSTKLKRGFSFLGKFGFRLIKERRQSASSLENKDFLQLLMDSRSSTEGVAVSNVKYSLSDKEIVGLCIDFMLAGYETTKNSMSYISYLLATNNDKQDLLCTAIDEYYQENEYSTLYDASHDIQYLDWVVSEGLRMYPPVSRIVRDCCDDCVINDIQFIKGSKVQTPVQYLHYSNEYWDQPNEFIPERFSPQCKEGRHPLCYLPFGYGQRSCIGMRFALMEIKMALTAVLRDFKFEISNDTQIPLKLTQGITQYPTDGVYLNIIKR